MARIWRNLFRAFLLKARNGDTAGRPFGWLAIKSGFEKGQKIAAAGSLWLMRLEGLAPTYSVDTAVGESDSIENQKVSTKFSIRHTRFLHQPFQCAAQPRLVRRVCEGLNSWKDVFSRGAHVWIWSGVSMSSRGMGASINYSEEVGFSGLTWGSPTGTLQPSWHCVLLRMSIVGIALYVWSYLALHT